jgi:hypothetical protein
MAQANNLNFLGIEAFETACKALSLELMRFGIEIKPHSDFGQKKAYAIEPYILDQISKGIEQETLRLSQITEHDQAHNSEAKNLWSFLKSKKFRFSTDLFSTLTNNHIIEVYDSSFKALYRNPNFYRNTSYTIDELHLFEWPELFYREQSITNQIARKVGEAFDSDTQKIVNCDAEPHEAKELFSSKRLIALMKVDLIAPLELTDGSRAVVTTLKILKLESNLAQI